MRSVYKVLGYVFAAEVAVQAMLMVFAIAGLGKFVDSGGVFDRAVMESDAFPFPEVVGFILHGLNGMIVIPVLALLMVVTSFFAKIPGASKWAAAVFLLVVVQVNLGFAGHDMPAVGALHGLNALVLFTSALYSARRVSRAAAKQSVDAPERVVSSG